MRRSRPPTHLGKGQMGSALIGVTANFMFLTEFVLGVLPLAYFYIPKSSRACLFPQSVKIHYFCSGPISVDPICPQPPTAQHRLSGHSDPAGAWSLFSPAGCRKVFGRCSSATCASLEGQVPIKPGTPNLPTSIVDFRGLDSSTILILRGGILMSMGNFP